MEAYIVGLVKIRDRDVYQRYIDGFARVLSRYRGQLVVSDGSPDVLEGEWPYSRVVVVRFADEAEARRWYASSEYQALMEHRLQSADAQIVMAHGLS